jgi:hypothetical protein
MGIANTYLPENPKNLADRINWIFTNDALIPWSYNFAPQTGNLRDFKDTEVLLRQSSISGNITVRIWITA